MSISSIGHFLMLLGLPDQERNERSGVLYSMGQLATATSSGGRELNLRLGSWNSGSSIQGGTRVSAPWRSWLESQNPGVPSAICVVVSLLIIISCRCPLEFSDVTDLA